MYKLVYVGGVKMQMLVNDLVNEDVLEIVKEDNFKSKLSENLVYVKDIMDKSRIMQKFKMINLYGWDPKVLEEVYMEYIKYIALVKSLKDFNIDFSIVPNKYIDIFWHEHILDSRAYFEDCQEIFGEYLHHNPYFGLRGEDDNKDWEDTAYLCNLIWEEVYGEKLYGNTSGDITDAYYLEKKMSQELCQLYFGDKSKIGYRMGCKPQRCP